MQSMFKLLPLQLRRRQAPRNPSALTETRRPEPQPRIRWYA